MVLAPIVRGRKGEYGKVFEELRAEGFARGQGRRRAADARGRDRARQEVQARHLGWSWSPLMRADVRKAPGGLDRDGGRAGRRHGRDRERCPRTARASTALPRGFACPDHGPVIRSSSRGSSRSSRRTARASAAPAWGSTTEIDPELVGAGPVAVDRRRCAWRRLADSSSTIYDQITRRCLPRNTGSTSRRRGPSSTRKIRTFLYGTDSATASRSSIPQPLRPPRSTPRTASRASPGPRAPLP